MRALAAAAAFALVASGARADGSKADLAAVRDTSSVEASGARVLQDTVRIHAPPAVVWKALTDQATYRAWVAPGSVTPFAVANDAEHRVSSRPSVWRRRRAQFPCSGDRTE